MQYGILFQNLNSHPTLPPGEQERTPNSRRLCMSTVQGNSTTPDVGAATQGSGALFFVGRAQLTVVPSLLPQPILSPA